MDFTSAGEWLDAMTFSRSYIKTRNLEELAARDPEIAEQVEALCRAILALRGPAMILQANNSLTYAAAAVAPFVTMQDAFDAAMQLKADAKQATAARAQRKTPESEIRKGRLSPAVLSQSETVSLRPSRMPSEPPDMDDGPKHTRRNGRSA